MKARPDSKRAKAEKPKKRTVKDTEPAGFVRECRFCEVIVLPEHIDVHVKGKKHKKLAGCADRRVLDVDQTASSAADRTR